MARASPHLQVQLLGSLRIERDSQLVDLSTRKFQSLFAYLTLFPQPHPREFVATLFWGDFPDKEARASLRNALTVLRHKLADDILITDRDTVQLNSAFQLALDVRELEAMCQSFDRLTARPESIVQLYRGDLLQDFYDEWVSAERARLRELYLATLLRLSEHFSSLNDHARALTLAEKILQLDSTNEPAHRLVMRGYHATGQRNAALKQYDDCERLLHQELGVGPSAATKTVYRQIKQAQVSLSAPEALVTNLPAPLSDFIGRKEQVAELTRLLAEHRLVTLTGAGGCGKTTLAVRVARDLVQSEKFADGVWWVTLAASTDGNLLPQAVTRVLGVRELPGFSLTDALIQFLRGKHLLLFLDECEHVVTSCASLAETLLRACPNLVILVASREALGIAGEMIFQLAPLATPSVDTRFIGREALLQYDSVKLFIARAQAIHPGFALNDKNALAIAQICNRLDGIPLAIELAAVRLKVLGIAQIAERLSDRFSLLTGGSRTALPHHQTLRAAIDWSYDSLSDAERLLLRRLTVFFGGWTLEQAETICADPAGALMRAEVLDLIAHLVVKSLVLVEPGDETRYRMLETIREYARGKLIDAGEAHVMWARHADYFCNLAEQAELGLRHTSQVQWLARIEANYENLRAALRWTLRRPDANDQEIAQGLRMVGALRQYWAIRCVLKEGLDWSIFALERSAHLFAEPTPAIESAQAKALNGASILTYLHGQLIQAAEFGEASMCLAQKLGDKWVIASNVYVLGEHERNYHQNLARAQALAEEGLTLARAGDDDWLAAVLLLNAGLQSRLQHDYVRAASEFAEGLERVERVGDAWIESALVDGLGSVAYLLGDYVRAISFYERALALRTRLKDKTGVAGSLNALGQAIRCQGDLKRARGFFDKSLVLWQELDQKDGVAQVLHNIARLVLRQGDWNRARKMLCESLNILIAVGNREMVVNCLDGLACVAAMRQEHARAARLFGAAKALHVSKDANVSPTDCDASEELVEITRATLGAALFNAETQAGQAMTFEQAIEFACSG